MKTIILDEIEAMTVVASLENFIFDCDAVKNKSQSVINCREMADKLLKKIKQWQDEQKNNNND